MTVFDNISQLFANINFLNLAGIMLRIDSLAADQQPDKTVFSTEGLKALFIIPGAPFSCAKSFEIKVKELVNLS